MFSIDIGQTDTTIEHHNIDQLHLICNVHTIPVFIYKLISGIIGGVLSKLINLSFSSGVFPSFLKIARVIPLFKSGDKYKKENFRPMSILHFIGKIFEKCMHKRLLIFFKRFHVISNSQFGFLSNRCTVDAITKFSDNIYNCFNNGEFMISVLLDLKRYLIRLTMIFCWESCKNWVLEEWNILV